MDANRILTEQLRLALYLQESIDAKSQLDPQQVERLIELVFALNCAMVAGSMPEIWARLWARPR